MIMDLVYFCSNYDKELFARYEKEPWVLVSNLEDELTAIIKNIGEGYTVKEGVAIHESAKIDPSSIIKSPAIIGPDCFIGPNSLLRSGVFLEEKVIIGPMCEVKCVYVCRNSAIAHFNYVGDSVIGSGVDLEAGAMVVNYYNEREDKEIYVRFEGKKINTKLTKFGAIIGDNTKIGANAVIAPGSIVPPNTVVKRLELFDTQ